MKTNLTKIEPWRTATLLGRLSSGLESDRGTVVHAVTFSGVALCGRRPGSRSAGWRSEESEIVTCTRCVKRLGAEVRS
jgi:hypothetical protein